MSALAKLCFSKGVLVSGSDKASSHITDELTHIGIDVCIGHKRKNVDGADLVVYTCAIGENNVELMEARKRGIKVMERADFLGELSKEYESVIAVAGSHGKTTVCSMLGAVFKKAGLNPTVLVGGESGSLGNLVIGGNKYLIVEACEYKRHFLKIEHDIAVILNIDFDHPDYYKSAKEYADAFEEFASKSREKNVISEKYKIFLGENSITFGTGGNYIAKHIRYFDGAVEFDVYKNQKFFQKFKLNLIGLYNVSNALCVISVCDHFGIDKKITKQALMEFEGVKRRYEYVGKFNSNIVITDYAHHPTQIENCIKATREIYKKDITVVFEPHTYSRTKFLFSAFVNALSLADNIILLPTYPARETALKGGTSKDLFNALKYKTSNVSYIKTYDKCLKELENINENIVLILGAGTINQIADQIRQKYSHNNSNCTKNS
jgi:UDP-N-acetylmuramate--alanine ligase